MGRLLGKDVEALFAASELITLFVWENTEKWPIKYCSDNAYKLLGYPKDELENGHVRFEDKVHPEDLERVMGEVYAAVADTSVRAFTHKDYRLVRKDGDIVWVSDTTILERDNLGHVKYLAGHLVNITERKLLEITQTAERNYLAQVIEGAQLASWDWDLNSDQVRLNTQCQRLLQLESPQLTRSQWVSLIHPEDQENCESLLRDHIRGCTPFYEAVFRMFTPQGKTLYLEDRGQVIKLSNNQHPLQMSGILTDITPHKEAELAAQKNAELRTQVLTNVSHEIRTPLHGILGLASLLENEIENKRQRKLLSTIRESGDYLLKSLNDVLDLTRAEKGIVEVDRKAEDVSAICHHVRDLFSESLRQKGLKFTCELDEGLPQYLWLDKARILQILINLVDNSIKYTHQGGIYVSFSWIQQEKSELLIRVADTGVGIKDVERVWKLFEKEHESNIRGSGVGLSVVKHLVTALGGKVKLNSGASKGTEFQVHIPAEESHNEPLPDDKTPELEMRSLNILIVDDSDVNQVVLGEMLASLGHSYISAYDGNDALDVIAQTDIDIVFMDWHMDELNGSQTTQKLREIYGDDQRSNLVIIGLTANALKEVKVEAIQVGMNDLLTKPFTLRDIKNAIDSFVKN